MHIHASSFEVLAVYEKYEGRENARNSEKRTNCWKYHIKIIFFFQLDSVTYVCIRVVSCYFRGKTEKDWPIALYIMYCCLLFLLIRDDNTLCSYTIMNDYKLFYMNVKRIKSFTCEDNSQKSTCTRSVPKSYNNSA